MPPQPSSASSFSSSTLMVTLCLPRARALPASTTASAKAGGVKSLGGMFTQSRAVATARATTWVSSNAVAASLRRAIGLSTTISATALADAPLL